ncbi:MAG: trypsin-like peptidase domain-containing protein [Candidatus Dasytiphilus stammeri]
MKKKSLVISTILILLFLVNFPFIIAKDSMPINNVNYLSNSLAPIVNKVIPSVVTIDTKGTCQSERSILIPQLRGLFSNNICKGDNGHSLACKTVITMNTLFQGFGTGIIIDASKGYVLTNNHVVNSNNVNDILISLNDGSQSSAKLIAKDQLRDLAILQLNKFKNLTAIKFADYDKIRVGDYTIAIGNTHGYGQSVTSGIISALPTNKSSLPPSINTKNPFGFYIKTDAKISNGNSGGPLVNLNGELIGINTAAFASNLNNYENIDTNINTSMAIPIYSLKDSIAEMLKYGDIKPGYLEGIRETLLYSSNILKAMKINLPYGFLINEVIPHSSAARYGIKSRDVILYLNGKEISADSSLDSQIARFPAGRELSIGLCRNGKLINIKVVLQTSAISYKKSKCHFN